MSDDSTMDDAARLLAGLDAPRRLPADLRQRLEEQLTTAAGADTVPLPLGGELDARLEQALSDPVAALLADVDGPRSLDSTLRDQLTRELTAPRRATARRAQRLLGAAAAVVLVVAVALIATFGGPRAGRHPSEGSSGSNGLSGPTGSVAGGQTGGNTAGGVAAGTGGAPGVATAQVPTSPVPGPLAASEKAVPPGQTTAGFGAGTDRVAAPTVTSVDPATGPVTGGTWVTVTGTGLQRAAAVHFGDAAATQVQRVSDAKLRVLSPRHLTGAVDVTVTTSAGTSAISNADHFTYVL